MQIESRKIETDVETPPPSPILPILLIAFFFVLKFFNTLRVARLSGSLPGVAHSCAAMWCFFCSFVSG